MSKMTTKNLWTETWNRIKEKYVDSTSQKVKIKLLQKFFDCAKETSQVL